MDILAHLRLDFPLNVYAHAIYLQEGQVDYLHYGLVQDQENLWELGALTAQQRATDLLLTHLIPPPATILEIGMGLGTTARLLAEKGYVVTALSPDPQQVAIAQIQLKGLETVVSLHCTTFEDFQIPQKYDIVLLQESAQYIKPLILFNKAYSLLTSGGQLLLMDEVGLKRGPEDQVEGLPYLKYLLAQAQRAGFQLTTQLDLSCQTVPTLDYLLTVIPQHEVRLLTDLALTVPQLQQLLHSLRRYQYQYRTGRYGYQLLNFQKQSPPRWTVTEVIPQHELALRDLFLKVFCHPISSDLWQWKYARGMGIAVWETGTAHLVAHYGGLERRLQYFGQPKLGVQIVDVMVGSASRGVFTRQGAYFLAGATFPECYAGYGTRILLGYGFPTVKAIHVAERLGLYAEVGKMVEVQWKTVPGRPHYASQIRHIHLDQQAKDRDLLNQLWQAMQVDFQQAIIGVRDADYVQYRYLQHPEKQYEILLVSRRLSRSPLGIAIISTDPDRAGQYRLLDLIAPLRHIPLVIQQVCRILGNRGVPMLTAWITENFAHHLMSNGAQQQLLEVRIPHCIWYEGPPLEEVRHRWWLMGGDTDFM